ncbi:MAG: rhomboid family intramembrane serine protease [Halapricum sp.]
MVGSPGVAMILQSAGIETLIDAVPLWAMQLLLVAAAAVSVIVCFRLVDSRGRWPRRIRSRLLVGVPWGTLLTLLFLLGMFLFVQGAYDGAIFDPRQPVTYAFTAWAYEYPLGVLTAAFSHGSFNHFLGNAIALAVFGTIAEYGYGHFPTDRGQQIEYGSRDGPYLRSVGFFLALLAVGLATAAFTPGPIIGFSGVVYALAGFALIVRPLTTVAGLLMTDVLSNLYSAFTNPITTQSPSVRYIDVWFADISVAGHLLGFLIGVLVGIALWRRRDETERTARLWIGVVVFGLIQGLWLVYWPLGNEEFALFRGVGVGFVFLVAAVVVVATAWPSRPLIPWPSRVPERIIDEMPSRGRFAAALLVVSVLSLSIAGFVTHLATVDSTELPNDPVQIQDYQVGYSENVTNQLYSVVDVPMIDQASTVQASGVIVYSERRSVWQVATSTSRLASNGYTRVTVGGVGWRETVGVTRTGWSVVGGDDAYRVRLYPPDDDPRLAFASEPATAEVVVANRSISLRPAGTDFEIVVERDNETLGIANVPAAGSNVTVADLRFERVDRNLYASYDGTRVRVANKKVPPTRRD